MPLFPVKENFIHWDFLEFLRLKRHLHLAPLRNTEGILIFIVAFFPPSLGFLFIRLKNTQPINFHTSLKTMLDWRETSLHRAL